MVVGEEKLAPLASYVWKHVLPSIDIIIIELDSKDKDKEKRKSNIGEHD